MKLKKTLCAVLAASALLTSTAFAKDNIYAYNKFISTVLGPQTGYCDFGASFVGHEQEYDNVNDYFSGLISAFYRDIDGDFDNELVTVQSNAVSVYRAGDNGVPFLGNIDIELIANYGDSYSNVFVVPREITKKNKDYIGVEVYAQVSNEYKMYLYELDPDSDEFKRIFAAEAEDNEDGVDQSVWANNKTYYSYTNAGGVQSSMNEAGYRSWDEAAWSAIGEAAGINGSGTFAYDAFGGCELKTHIKATGLRFSEKPIVIFEDHSQLSELSVKPDIVTVTLDGSALQFPTQDPVIVDGRTLVPMRTIFEALGATVDWIDDGVTQKIVANTADKDITMTINSNEFFVNGDAKELDVPAQLMNDKTMVPLRAISESLGCAVDWNGDTKTVVIQTGN